MPFRGLLIQESYLQLLVALLKLLNRLSDTKIRDHVTGQTLLITLLLTVNIKAASSNLTLQLSIHPVYGKPIDDELADVVRNYNKHGVPKKISLEMSTNMLNLNLKSML